MLMAQALGHTFREGNAGLGYYFFKDKKYLWLKNVLASLAYKAWKETQTYHYPRCHQQMNSMAQHFATTYVPQPHCFMNNFIAPLIQT